MNKKGLTLYSLIPVVLILLLIIGAGFFLLKDDIKLQNVFNKGPQVTRIEGFPVVLSASTNVEKQRVVIKSQEELANFLKAVDPNGQVKVPTNINFNKTYLIGVASSTQNQSGAEIKIRKLYEDKEDKVLTVSVRQIDPSDSCVTTQQLTIPVDLVQINKTDYRIKFEAVKEENPKCTAETKEASN